MGRFETRQAAFGTGLLLATGLALLAVPLFDMWSDVMVAPHKSPTSTLIENSLPILLASLLLAIAGWLVAVRDWDGHELYRTGRWTAAAAIVAAVLMVWIVGIQVHVQNDLKPFILAANAVIAAALAGLAVGVYDVRRHRHRRQLKAESDRFTALYDNTTDAIVTLSRSTDGKLVTDPDGVLSDGAGGVADLQLISTNNTYDELFDRDPGSVVDVAQLPSDERLDSEAVARHIREGNTYQEEIRAPVTVDGEDVRDFKLRVVPTNTTYSYLVFTDITNQKQRQRTLERKKSAREEELEERTNQLEFLHSLLRHDVQNGMMVIRSRAEFLADHVEGRLAKFTDTIVSRSDDVSEQIDRMRTTLETLTSEEWATEPTPVHEVVDDRVAAAARSYPDATFEIDGDLPQADVEADGMLTDVIDNLLYNGVDHHDTGEPEIRVAATEREDSVRVSISDDGPGVPEERRDEVFRRGVTSANQGGDSGSGFGLFFVDTMVDAYDGDVWVEESDAGGARFVLDLPKSTSDTEADR